MEHTYAVEIKISQNTCTIFDKKEHIHLHSNDMEGWRNMNMKNSLLS